MNMLDFLSSCHFYHDHHITAFRVRTVFKHTQNLTHDNHPPLSPVKMNKHSNLSIWLKWARSHSFPQVKQGSNCFLTWVWHSPFCYQLCQ